MTNGLPSSRRHVGFGAGGSRLLFRQWGAFHHFPCLPRDAIASALRVGMAVGVLAVWVLSGMNCIALDAAGATARGVSGFSAPGRGDRNLSAIQKLVESGDLAAARRMLAEEIASRGESYETIFLEAKILFHEHKYEQSLKVLERALALNQRDPELYKLVASDAILIERMDIAEQALKRAAQLAPKDYLVFFNLGALYYTDSRFAIAQSELEKSVSLNPDYVPAQLFLGLSLEELGQEPRAMDCYHRAIELAERSGFKGEQPYLYPGRLLYRQNKLEESLPYLQKAAKANPQSCETLCLLARIYTSQDRETDADAALNQCVQADPQYSEAHYLLSRIYARQGRTKEATRELALFQESKKHEQNKKDYRKNQRARH